jgi:hypothetical protein
MLYAGAFFLHSCYILAELAVGPVYCSAHQPPDSLVRVRELDLELPAPVEHPLAVAGSLIAARFPGVADNPVIRPTV